MTEQTIEERLEQINEEAELYLKKIGAKIKQPEHVDRILSISYDVMKSLGYEECGENAFILHQQAYFLQQELNYHKSRMDWCDSTLAYFIANYSTDDKFVKRDEKAAKLAINNTAVKSLLKMFYTAKTYVTHLERLSERTEKMANSYEQLQFSRRKLTIN